MMMTYLFEVHEMIAPEMHAAKLVEANKARRPFSIWRPGELIGRTFNPCSDCLVIGDS